MMRYRQAEKLEIIRLVETSDLPVKHTLAELAVPRHRESSHQLVIARIVAHAA